MPSVLFVCSANRCRSPMAAALFNVRLSQAGLMDSWRVESAGTWAQEGQPATAQAMQVARERGLSLDEHRSRRVTAGLLRDFDLILTMDLGHQEALRIEFPELAARIHLLAAMAGEAYAIEDPVGSPFEVYRSTLNELDGLLRRGFKRILEEASR